jgi:hypothetical protein
LGVAAAAVALVVFLRRCYSNKTAAVDVVVAETLQHHFRGIPPQNSYF